MKVGETGPVFNFLWGIHQTNRGAAEKAAQSKWQSRNRGEQCDQRGLQKKERGLSTPVSHAFETCPAIFVSHVCMNSQRGEMAGNCLVKNPAHLKMPLLNHTNLLSIKTSSNVRFSLMCVNVHPPLGLLRCVCTSPSLRLPAVPEGPADQTGVPDSVFPRRLSGCRHCVPHCNLSHLHRYVCSQGFRGGFTSSNTQFMYLYRLLSAQTKKQNLWCACCTWKSVQTTKTNERGTGENEPHHQKFL